MNAYPSVLIVDDEKNTREGLKTLLELHNYEVDIASDGFQALDKVKMDLPDIVLTDLRMPEMDGIEVLKKIKVLHPDTIVIVLTAYGTVETAVQAMQNGAFHYLTKPINTNELLEILKKAVSMKKLEQENKDLKKQIRENYEFGEIIYSSQEMKNIIETVKQAAPSNASFIITGESGTGKELIARMIHIHSERKNGPFIPVHCAALSETLLESELFGHERGSFTGAVERKLGRFERAHKGTLFLDEIGEIPESMQVKLLRVLQDGEFERVGGTKIIKSDVRVIAATNKNIEDMVRQGKFREDLFYRLNVVSVHLPPLRERRDDIEPLIDFYLDKYARINHKNITKIDEQVRSLLRSYSWPGNIRELRNVIERMVVLSKGPIIDDSHVPRDMVNQGAGVKDTELNNKNIQIKDMEREMILNAIKQCKGNKSLVAKQLGISRRTLYRKLEQYNIKE